MFNRHGERETPAFAGDIARQFRGREDTCILIASCDAYSDAWAPFFALMQRYWPDCPYPVYLISNQQEAGIPGVHSLTLNEDRKWAGNMLAALERLPYQRILYLQEDYFLQRPVNNQTIQQVLDFAEQTGAGFIRLAGWPDPELSHVNSLGLGQLAPKQKFRVSLQAGLWQRATLEKLLIDGESGWEMEIQGSERSQSLAEPFFAVSHLRPIIDYYVFTAILKGKWVPGALRLCRREGIDVDTSRRGIHGEWPFLVRNFRNMTMMVAARKWWKRIRGRAA